MSATTMDTGNGEDGQLVARVRAGHREAFEAIMRRYNRRLYRLAWSVLRNPTEAEDVVQETYLRAYGQLDSFVGPEGFGAWLAKIALNEARGRLRRAGRAALLVDEILREGGVQLIAGLDNISTPTPERLAAAAELRTALEAAIAALPDDFRSVFILRAIEGLSIAETAALLEIPAATVKTRLHRARAALQRLLRREAEQLMPDLLSFAGARCDRIVARVLARITDDSKPTEE
jgi:RNA polymerase sigma-70 factor (ECF subfamily)